MSTLTLAVNDYFKPDLAANSDGCAPQTSPPSAPCCTAHKSAPSSSQGLLFGSTVQASAYTYSKSTTDLSKEARSTTVAVPMISAPRTLPDTGNASITLSQQLVEQSTNTNSIPSTIHEDTTRAGSDAPPLRKLKLSLKLPKLTKLFSTSNLLPKLVRFASRLENVKMFDGRDSPSTVSLQNTPTGSPQMRDFDLSDYFSSHRNFTDLGLSDDDDDSDSDSDTFSEYTKNKQYKVSSLNYSAPKNLYDKQDMPVYLQQTTLSADKKLLLVFVMCKNLAYEKKVSVKLTYNNWQSTLIFNNPVHVKLFTSVNFDQFKFTVPLTHLPSSINAQFCIKYDVNGQTHWDNNASRNFNIILTSFVAQKPVVAQKPQRDTFTYKAPTFSPVPKQQQQQQQQPATIPLNKPASSGPQSYDELINKLILVSANATKKPALHHSASLPALKPRYSQSFRAKHGDTKQDAATPSVATASSDARLAGSCKPAAAPQRMKPVASFQDSKFNSSSYATLLQTYCFNGASTSPSPSASESMANSRSSSSSSVNSDYMSAPSVSLLW